MDPRRVAVVMAGGSGERFWPVSTPERPKQFLRLASPERTLLQQSVERLAPVVGLENVMIATGEPLAAATREACPELPSQNVLAEPARRNTAGCLVWVAANLMATHPEGWGEITMAVATADHRIAPQDAFERTLNTALLGAEENQGLVTIGIRPTRPDTAFGYVEVGPSVDGVFKALRFREKPDVGTARRFLAEGNFLWNSGMFFWRLETFMEQLVLAAPEMAKTAQEIAYRLQHGDETGAKGAFEELRSTPIDVALLERSSNVYVVEAEFEWDDLGSWDAMARSYEPDAGGNVSLGPTRMLYTRDSIVYNDSSRQQVSILGMDEVVVVVTDDHVLVCPKNRAQDVRKLAH